MRTTQSAGGPRLDGLGPRWAPSEQLIDLTRTRRTNHRPYGTISRYSAVTDDGIEREIIHGQCGRRNSPLDLTIGTAPPLSLGPEGLTMHFLLKSMETGLDALVFGPERSPRCLDTDSVKQMAQGVSFASSARAAHLISDRLTEVGEADLGTMLWTGISLGANKGIAFAALAPSAGRTVAYSHFVAAVPYPVAPPTRDDVRRFNRAELGALVRLSTELFAHDMRKRMFRLNANVARAMRPGLTWHYAQSVPSDSASNIFTEAWRIAVCTGDGGVAATRLPPNRLVTLELYEHDAAGPPDGWRRRLQRVLSPSIRIIVKSGRHADAIRISHQRDRARRIQRVIAELRRGVPVEELQHPFD